ncbi:hypothetical protein [Lacticaseibacillus suibinensis]|uniref:hypothetical protein n=1 Tax=Lacticaseibacillus suibinensis TaxID=2486011 RepID=UPI000F77A52F|nr:hypothetical protein [Lacticaseibacillus suibinensis]
MMGEGEYITVCARLWQPKENDDGDWVDDYSVSNVVMKRADFQRWLAGDKGGVVLTIDDGQWQAVKLDNIVDMSASECK